MIALALALPTAASAAPIVLSAPQSFTVTFDGNVAGTTVDGLSATADFVFQGFTDLSPTDGNTEANFSITLTNTTLLPLESRTSALAFDVTPNVTGGSVTGLFTNFVLNGSLPNGFGPVEVCVNDAGGSCAGGGGGGLANGDQGTFQLTLIFSGVVSSISLDNFGVRYQSIDGLGFNGDSGTGSGVPTPEPGTLLLVGGGAAAALTRWRKARLNRA